MSTCVDIHCGGFVVSGRAGDKPDFINTPATVLQHYSAA
jgi:hypothetical protein